VEVDEQGVVVSVRECTGAAEIDAMAGVEFYSGTILIENGACPHRADILLVHD
jgi:hypothetical protein